MSNTTEVISIAEVLELSPGDENNPTWINGEIRALVAAITPKKSKANKPYWALAFADEVQHHAQVHTTMFTAPKFSIGDVVMITGSGIRRTAFKETQQIALSAKSEIHVVGRGVTGQQPGNSAPAPARTAPPPASGGYASTPPPPTGLFIPHGASVGMAVKEAIALSWRDGSLVVGTPEFWKVTYKHASDILRLMHTLETGRLAPRDGKQHAAPEPQEAPPERPAPPPPVATPRPVAGPGGAVAHGPDEDVPF